MGNARWSDVDWNSHRRATSGKSRSEIFTSATLDPLLDPAKIKFRESRDSAANPNSTPVILAVDVTGSMGILAEHIVRRDLGIIMSAIYDKKPVSDPHIMCMAIGDACCDQAPLQVTQFEAAVNPLTEQVMKIWLEGGGGGNDGESYALPWLFAAAKTKCDAIKKGRKGYLFTIGDESCLPTITKEQARKFLDVPGESDIDAKLLHDHLAKDWNVFHLIVETSATETQGAIARWKALLGERAIVVPNHENLAEGIVVLMQMLNGMSRADAKKDWSGNRTAEAIADQFSVVSA